MLNESEFGMKHYIICMDPGRVNWAYSVMTDKGKVLRTGLWKHTLTELKDGEILQQEINRLKRKMFKLLATYSFGDCTYDLVYERMIPRGFNMKKNTAEIVNMCIGCLLTCSSPDTIAPYSAATWKNHRTKHGLEIVNKTLAIHIIDSISMGLYYLIQNNKLTITQAKKLVKKYSKRDCGWRYTKGEWIKE